MVGDKSEGQASEHGVCAVVGWRFWGGQGQDQVGCWHGAQRQGGGGHAEARGGRVCALGEEQEEYTVGGQTRLLTLMRVCFRLRS